MGSRPILDTERLRPFVLSDVADVQRLAGEWAIAEIILNVPHPYEDGMTEAWSSTPASNFEVRVAVQWASEFPRTPPPAEPTSPG